MRIAIIGAGVSGVILGSLLKKNFKCELTIFEKRSKIFDNTNGIQLSPNSIKILELLNFKEILKKEDYLIINKLIVRDLYSQKLLSEIILNFKNLNNYITIDRSVLLKKFFEYYRLFENLKNIEVQSIDYETNEVFLNNQKLKYDFIFLCDGIFSKLKKNTELNNLIFTGLYALRGTFFNTNNDYNINLYLGNNEHFVNYRLNNLNKDKYNFVWIINKKFKNDKLNINGYDKKDEKLIKLFFEKFKTKFDFFKKISDINVWPIYKNKKIVFGKKNVIYIGDSSHGFIPSRAQGASQAIEDAYHSFKLLKSGNLSTKNLNKARFKRIKKIIKKSENTIIIYHLTNKLLKGIRNLVLGCTSKSKIFSLILNKSIFSNKL